MNAVILHSHSHKSAASLSFYKQITTFNDGRTTFTLRKNVLRLNVSSSSSGDRKISEFADEELHGLAKKEKMIALLRRIQSSISKAEATRAKQDKPDLPDKSPAPKDLPRSQKPAKAKLSRGRKGHQVSASKRIIPQMNDRTREKPQQSEARSNVTRLPSKFVTKSPLQSLTIPRGKAIEENNDFSAATRLPSKKSPIPTLSDSRGKPIEEHNDSAGVTRPPSSFMKKSPIPSLSIPRGIPMVEKDDFSEATDRGEVPMKDLKLPQLKELAKSRGIKGYSKLKKSQLLELLSP